MLGHYAYELDGLGNRVVITESVRLPVWHRYLPLAMHNFDGGESLREPEPTRMAPPRSPLSAPGGQLDESGTAYPRTQTPFANPASILMIPLVATAVLGRKKKWRRWAWLTGGVLLVIVMASFGLMIQDSKQVGAGKDAASFSTEESSLLDQTTMITRTITYTPMIPWDD